MFNGNTWPDAALRDIGLQYFSALGESLWCSCLSMTLAISV